MPLHSHLPHLSAFEAFPIVYVTVCTAGRRPILAHSEIHGILRAIWTESGPGNQWSVGRYVLMPDHAHLFARPGPEAMRLADWVKLWKALSSRAIAKALGIRPPVWQADYYDRYLRSADDYSQKWEYVWRNPEVAAIAPDPASWPYQGEIVRLRY